MNIWQIVKLWEWFFFVSVSSNITNFILFFYLTKKMNLEEKNKTNLRVRCAHVGHAKPHYTHSILPPMRRLEKQY